ncbi:hypothetical protein HanIR_Chr01g0037561 [Helianthus annuus]|nr:hypothetical protein HanIR_Chr01g0037561 [Helianthus annuus]
MISNSSSSKNMESSTQEDDKYIDETCFVQLDNDLDSVNAEPSSKRKQATNKEEPKSKAQKVAKERAEWWRYYEVVYLEGGDGVKRRHGRCKACKSDIKADALKNGC